MGGKEGTWAGHAAVAACAMQVDSYGAVLCTLALSSYSPAPCRWSPMELCWAMQARCHWPETTYMGRLDLGSAYEGGRVQPGWGI